MRQTKVLYLTPFEFSQTSGKPLDEVHRMIRDGELEVINTIYGRNVVVIYSWYEIKNN
ncbi:hypothetical protein [Hungatella effluvii]|uniref:hypothetical protein n=1 Tax=Hungatella effluvii TaxID=1096246 RepID=UPI0022E2DD1C|nr:hypothetical protein [Hungatella effluvii]